MKKLLVLLIVALMAAWLSSCSDDPTPPQSPTVQRPLSTLEAMGSAGAKSGDHRSTSAVGDAYTSINVPVPAFLGVGVAVDCEGNIYYTNYNETNLYVIDKTGALITTLPTTDNDGGAALNINEIAWDGTTGKLWGAALATPPKVYLIDPTTGGCDYKFSMLSATYSLVDGIAYDASDNSIWITDDVSTDIEHWDAATSTHLGDLVPLNAAGDPLGFISGVAVGKGDVLYLGQNGLGKIVTVDKATGAFISEFSSPGGRDEGLECDVVNFPVEVLWSRDAYLIDGVNHIDAIEVESGTCACQGGTLEAPIDIKPGSCPNPLNVGDQGVLPVAILGTEDFDVSLVDLTTVNIAGVAPVNSATGDVAAPYIGDLNDCLSCWTAGPDGYADLSLKFSAQAIVGILGTVTDGSCITLTVTGLLKDGTPFAGSDIVRIIKKSNTKKGGGT